MDRSIRVTFRRLVNSGMKKLITGLILISLLSTTGCILIGQPPEYSVGNPVAVPDGSGGIVVAYQINQGNGRTTYFQSILQNSVTY